MDQIWDEFLGDGPLVATAVHNGHDVRAELIRLMALDDDARLREEDPWTAQWTTLAPTRFIGLRSRFEVDLNRPRESAVYRTPEDAWGLEVWRSPLPDDVVQRSLESYDAFYARLREVLDEKVATYGAFVIFDLHTYNHRRGGPEGPPAPAEENPQINLGTGSMDRARWSGVVERFTSELKSYEFPGGGLDVRENVRFRGGNLAQWAHRTYPETGCVLAVEAKKFFMDEWTGEPDPILVTEIGSALAWTVAGVQEELGVT